MTEIYMLTMPQYSSDKLDGTDLEISQSSNYARLKLFVRAKDIHKWIIGKETGKGGYKHLQVRLRTSESFEILKEWFPDAHIEKASDTWDYERKEARFICSDDNPSILSCRFGKLRANQSRILARTLSSGDRNIVTVFDPKGCNGKSWLCRFLYETGKGYYVPPTCKSTKDIIQFVASGYKREPIIAVDIPRTCPWTDELLIGLEQLKDGLIFDTRYHATTRDIWGVKILVFTNTKPNITKLSKDRWIILNAEGEDITGKFLQKKGETPDRQSTPDD